MPSLASNLEQSLVLISCEGEAENTIISILKSNDAFCFPPNQILDITNKRKACDIQEEYLNIDYGKPLFLLRIVDSKSAQFQLGNLYRERCVVYDIHTRPEIEMLVIIREGMYDTYQKVASSMKPSDFCKQTLRMPYVKRPTWLNGYWDFASLKSAIIDYRRLHRLSKGELCLADILA